jgi:hypothetical protein
MMHPIADWERDSLAPSLRRACAVLLHWENDHDSEGLSYVFSEMKTVTEATDTILALLMLREFELGTDKLRRIAAYEAEIEAAL